MVLEIFHFISLISLNLFTAKSTVCKPFSLQKKEKCILLRLPMLKIYFCGIQIFCIILPNGILQVRQFIF